MTRFNIVKDVKKRPYIMSGEEFIFQDLTIGDEQIGFINVYPESGLYLNLEELKILREVVDGIIQRIEYRGKTQ